MKAHFETPEKKARTLDTRKLALTVVFLALSLSALGWQWNHYRRTAEAERLPLALQWRNATPEEREAVTASITAQLEAFKRDDYQSAAKHQSAALRRNFSSLLQFRAMIQKSYPQFARYKSVQFGSVQAEEKGQLALVPVTVVGSDGRRAEALYQMVFEANLWRVAGVSGGGINPPERPSNASGQTAV